MNSPEGTRQKVELFAVVLEAGGFTVGSDNQLSGLFAYDGQTWMHRGWPNIRAFGLALHADNNQMLYLAAGNGVLRSSDGGNSWRVLTDWRITEVLDVVIDPLNANHLIAATAHGIWRSDDGGDRWVSANNGLVSTFVQSLAVQPDGGQIWAGTEAGVFASDVGELRWRRDGLADTPVRQLDVGGSTTVAAATKSNGAWLKEASSDWRRIGGVPADATYYTIAFDHGNPDSLAVGGLFSGVYVSDDRGSTSRLRAGGAPASPVHALTFDPIDGSLVAGTTDNGVYRLSGQIWTRIGLSKASIRRLIYSTR